MKEEINTILGCFDPQGDEGISRLRNWVLLLDKSQPKELREANLKLIDAIKQANIQTYQQVGVYDLFLGCVYFEQDEYLNSIHCLQNTVNEIIGTQVNKSITHWLLALSFHNVQDFPSARQELLEALQLLDINTSVNTPRTNSENCLRQSIRQKIQNELVRLRDEPIFRNTLPAPVKSADPTPMQNPPVEGNDVDSGNTVASSPVKNQKTGNFTYQETHTAGYISFQSLPVYEQTLAAGRSGKPEIELNEIGLAETKIIILDNKPHEAYPLKRESNEIRIATNEKKWGWVKVCGRSMNKIGNKTSIADGDFVLLLFSPVADDNDIVLASFEDPQTTQNFLTVKRYRKEELSLKSETSEIGTEYENINLGGLHNARIIGVVYAVAKPTAV